jgi:hypothetical protein
MGLLFFAANFSAATFPSNDSPILRHNLSEAGEDGDSSPSSVGTQPEALTDDTTAWYPGCGFHPHREMATIGRLSPTHTRQGDTLQEITLGEEEDHDRRNDVDQRGGHNLLKPSRTFRPLKHPQPER